MIFGRAAADNLRIGSAFFLFSNEEKYQNLQKSLLEMTVRACLIDFRVPFRCQEESAGLPGC